MGSGLHWLPKDHPLPKLKWPPAGRAFVLTRRLSYKCGMNIGRCLVRTRVEDDEYGVGVGGGEGGENGDESGVRRIR